ncbi:MAG: hypothetical protein D6773_19385, partial [Alphaproteobacteria bacterium]
MGKTKADIRRFSVTALEGDVDAARALARLLARQGWEQLREDERRRLARVLIAAGEEPMVEIVYGSREAVRAEVVRVGTRGARLSISNELLRVGSDGWEEPEDDVVSLRDRLMLSHPIDATRLLTAPVRVPLLWDERRARLFACDCADRALKAVIREGFLGHRMAPQDV